MKELSLSENPCGFNLCSGSGFSTIPESKGYFVSFVEDCFLNRYRPDGGIPIVRYLRPLFKSADIKPHFLALLTGCPSCQAEWVPSDSFYEQCAITATLVYDMFGGTIYSNFNKIDGHYIDITIEKLDLYNITVSCEPNEKMPGQYCCRLLQRS